MHSERGLSTTEDRVVKRLTNKTFGHSVTFVGIPSIFTPDPPKKGSKADKTVRQIKNVIKKDIVFKNSH